MKLQNPKNTYIRKFTEISKKLEKISTEEGIPYNTLYRVYEEMLESYINNYKNFKFDTIKIFDKYKIKGNNIFDKYYIRGLGLLIGKRAKELSDAKEAMSLMK